MQVTIVGGENPQYADDTGDAINLVLTVSAKDGVERSIPFTASKNDPETHGREIYDLAKAGEYGAIAAYVPPPDPEPAPE
jgi:hypothetical protein